MRCRGSTGHKATSTMTGAPEGLAAKCPVNSSAESLASFRRRGRPNQPPVHRANPEPVFGPRRLTRKRHHLDRVLGRGLGATRVGWSNQDDTPDATPKEMADARARPPVISTRHSSRPMAGALWTSYDPRSQTYGW